MLMAKQTNRGKRSVFNETHLQKIFFENLRTTCTKLCEKKERTSEQCHEFVKLEAQVSLYRSPDINKSS